MDRVRRRRVPGEGPQGRRLHAGPHPRGDVHPPRQGPVQQLQGPAAVHLPDPDEVPRRGPAARRPAARPGVRDEGLLQLRPRPRRLHGQLPGPSRRLRAHVPTSRAAVRDRRGDVRGDGRVGQRGVPRAARGRRGHLRPLHELRLRGQHRGGARAHSPGPVDRRRPGGTGGRHPGHADDPDARRPAQRPCRPGPRRPAVDRRRHAEERRSSRCATRTAPPPCWRSGCPATATST